MTMQQVEKRLVTFVRRYPFTIFLILVSWAAGLAAQTYRKPLPADWLKAVGINAHNLESGRIYTVITPVFFSSSPLMFYAIALFLAGGVGIYEHLAGTRRAFILYWSVNILTLLAVIYLIGKPLEALHIGLGKTILKNPEVGPSAGGYACIGGTFASLPPRYRRPALILILLYLIILKPIIHFEAHGDTAHLVAFILGYIFVSIQLRRKSAQTVTH